MRSAGWSTRVGITAVAVCLSLGGGCAARPGPRSLTITNDQSNPVIVRLSGVAPVDRFFDLRAYDRVVVLEVDQRVDGDVAGTVTVLSPTCEVISTIPIRLTQHEVLSVADPNPESKMSFGTQPDDSVPRAAAIADPCRVPRSATPG